MEQVEFFVTPGFGERLRDSLNYSQAVRIGNRVEISGQGGWTDTIEFPDSLHDEYVLAFDNVGRVLAAAGASWDDVTSIDSFHVPLDDEALGAMAAQLRSRMPSHKPIWTALGVAQLGDARMHVEIRVVAIVNQQRA